MSTGDKLKQAQSDISIRIQRVLEDSDGISPHPISFQTLTCD